MNLLETIWYKYQRAFWYIGVGKNELLKPLGQANETIWVLTLLATYSIKPPLPLILLIYLLVLVAFLLLGFIVKKSKAIEINNQASNEVNPQIIEILERLQRIESKL